MGMRRRITKKKILDDLAVGDGWGMDGLWREGKQLGSGICVYSTDLEFF
jgi:hypothetical protein